MPTLVKKYKHSSAFHIFFVALRFLGDFWGGGRGIYFLDGTLLVYWVQ